MLTGSPAESFLADLYWRINNRSTSGAEGRKTGTILFHKKIDIDDYPRVLTQVAEAIDRLADVELARSGHSLTLAKIG